MQIERLAGLEQGIEGSTDTALQRATPKKRRG
jgi:hypothetical protein